MADTTSVPRELRTVLGLKFRLGVAIITAPTLLLDPDIRLLSGYGVSAP